MNEDCFTLGSTVAVKTMHDDLIEGQVMAFDLSTKLLILSKSNAGKFFIVILCVFNRASVLSRTFVNNSAADLVITRFNTLTVANGSQYFSSLVLETNSDLPRLNNVYIVNLLLCKDINVKKEVNGAEQQEPQSINLQKVEYFANFQPNCTNIMSKFTAK